MTTLEKNLKKKLKKLKQDPETLKKIEEIKPTRSEAFFGYSKEKRLEAVKNRQEIAKQVDKVITKFSKSEINDLAKATGLSTKAVRSIVDSKKSFKQWKARQTRGVNMVGMVVLSKLIRTVNESRLSGYQAGLLFQMLKPQIIKEISKTDAMTSINIGDNRRVSVYYPNFTPKDKVAEYNTVVKEKPEE